MAHLINTFDYELKETVESLKYFEKIDFYDNAKYMVVIFNNKTYYYTFKLFSNVGDNISFFTFRSTEGIEKMILYSKILILINNKKFIKCINILTQNIILDVEHEIVYGSSFGNKTLLLNNLLIYETYEKCINKDTWMYHTNIFNLDTYETKHLKKCSFYCKNPEHNNVSNEFKMYIYSKKTSSNFFMSLNKWSIDNRFIFLSKSDKKYMCLYDTLKNVELKYTIMYHAYYIPFFHNYIINYVTHEQSYHMIDFSDYISDIYEKEKLEEKKDYIIAGEPDHIIEPGYTDDTKSSHKPSYLGKKVNIVDLSNMNDCWIKLKHHKSGKVYYKNPHTDETRDFIIDKSLIYYPSIGGETS